MSETAPSSPEQRPPEPGQPATNQGAPPRSASRPRGHGTSSFARIMDLGAFAALDQRPPDPARNLSVRPAWPERFGLLVSAYDALRRGDERTARQRLKEAELAPAERPRKGDDTAESAESAGLEIGEIVVAHIGSGEGARERFEALFGSPEDAGVPGDVPIVPGALFSTYTLLPPLILPCWIIQLICCALGYRRNTFGRYFAPKANPLPTESNLLQLSLEMHEGFDDPAADADVPAGFTFFGQFVDHDITLDATTRLSDERFAAGDILNERSPSFDLDNVYGGGPEASPELYKKPAQGFGVLLVGPGGSDLPRNQENTAIIGDHRNDENAIVSQLHLHMLHFHNAILRNVKTGTVDTVWQRQADEPADERGDFEFARRLARWHYQWALVHDWLPRIIDDEPLAAAMHIVGVPDAQGNVPKLPAGYKKAKAFFDGLLYLNCCGNLQCRPLMPVEFSGAAFRFAHSQVRSRYDINDNRLAVPLFNPTAAGLASFGPVPQSDLVDWRRFFEIEPGFDPQRARKIDTWLPAQVFQLPFAPNSPNLAFRNLVRGARVYALPTGGEVAAQLGLTLDLAAEAVMKLQDSGFGSAKDAPLWFAVLGEAEKSNGKLGPIGGLLVAATLLRILRCDERSYVHHPGWQPVLEKSAPPGEFTVADMVRIGVNERKDAFP